MKVYNDNQLYEVASWRPTMKFWSPELNFWSHWRPGRRNFGPWMGWVCCWFSPLLRDLFLRVLRFTPLLKNQHFQIPIRSGTHGHVSTSSHELLTAPWVNKLQYSFTIIEAFTNWTYSLKSIKCTCVNSTNVVEIRWWFVYVVLVG